MFFVENVGSDTLYYDPCSGSVYLDELDPEVPRAFNVGNLDQCIQREPIAPSTTVAVDMLTSRVADRMLAAGLAPRYRLRLVDYFFRRLLPDERQGLRKFEDYIRIEGVTFSDPFRFYYRSR